MSILTTCWRKMSSLPWRPFIFGAGPGSLARSLKSSTSGGSKKKEGAKRPRPEPKKLHERCSGIEGTVEPEGRNCCPRPESGNARGRMMKERVAWWRTAIDPESVGVPQMVY